jgi:methylated-DNA-[protein]-cysteine S-methyltransferase
MRTPLGELLVVTDEAERLRVVEWTDAEERVAARLRELGPEGAVVEDRTKPSHAATALAAYFEGELGAIEALPVELRGTPFQRAVWAALCEIPCGATVSYGAIAKRIGRPAAVRAVGMANHANPVGIVVPCHRVVGADGSLTGYGGGLERKRWLLAHEAAAPGPLFAVEAKAVASRREPASSRA